MDGAVLEALLFGMGYAGYVSEHDTEWSVKLRALGVALILSAFFLGTLAYVNGVRSWWALYPGRLADAFVYFGGDDAVSVVWFSAIFVDFGAWVSGTRFDEAARYRWLADAIFVVVTLLIVALYLLGITPPALPSFG